MRIWHLCAAVAIVGVIAALSRSLLGLFFLGWVLFIEYSVLIFAFLESRFRRSGRGLVEPRGCLSGAGALLLVGVILCFGAAAALASVLFLGWVAGPGR